MNYNLILVCLIQTCVATINITIIPSSERNNVKILYKGFDKKTVTDMDIKLFNMTAENMNRGFRVEMGSPPDRYYMKDPTPNGDLFQRYHWEATKRLTRVSKAEVLEFIAEKVVLKVEKIKNNSTDPYRAMINVYDEVENSARSFWDEAGVPRDDFSYNVSIDFNGHLFHYTNKWRSETYKIAQIPIGISRNAFVNIKSGQKLSFVLSAYKFVLLIKIDYESSMTGSIIADHEEEYGKYHYWAPSVKSIMKAAKMNNEVHTKELLEIRGHIYPELQIFDTTTGEQANVAPPKSQFVFF